MMRWVFLAMLLVNAATLPAARALSPGCDQCADLPTLYRELLEQEFLRNRFERWIREAYFPISIDAIFSVSRFTLPENARRPSASLSRMIQTS